MFSEQVLIRLTPELKDALQQAARRRAKVTSALAREILAYALDLSPTDPLADSEHRKEAPCPQP